MKRQFARHGIVLTVVLMVIGLVPPAPRVADAQDDAAIVEISPIQTIAGYPLVLGKDTLVRVAVRTERAGDATLVVSFDGRDYEEEVELEAGQQWIDVFVDPPQEPGPLPVTATLTGDVEDEASVEAFVVSPTRRLKLFYLPIDWTPEERREYDYDETVPYFVELQSDFMEAAYPLPADWIESGYSPTPHMVASHEKALVDSRGEIDSRVLALLYASIYLAANRLAPDADFVVAILPPDWFETYYGEPLFGLQFNVVNGLVLSAIGIRGRLVLEEDPTTTAHEMGHVFDLLDDYDQSVDPPVAGRRIDAPGYWVYKQLPKEDSDAAPIFSFMATGGQPDYWVNTATYGHLMQRLTDWDGRSGLLDTSAEPVDDDPDLRAASAEITMAKDLNDAFEPIEPTDTYEPDESFHASIEVANVPNGIQISNRWYFGSVLLREAGTTTRQDVSRQLLASVLTSPEEGWEPGDYRLEVYFADELMDTAEFSVE